MTTLSASAPATPVRSGPIRWRWALLTAVAVYPAITAFLYVIFPLTEGWQLWQRTLLLVPLMVSTMVYLITPAIQKHLGWFIVGKARPATRN